MQVSVENISSLERKLHVTLPEVQLSKEVDSRLENMTKTTRVQGFRPGKVPLKIIKSRYGESVRNEVAAELVRSSLYTAIEQEQLKPVAQPRIDEFNDEAGKGLSFIALFEVYPEVELKPMTGIKVEKATCEVSADDVAKRLEMLREYRSELEQVNRAAKESDVININFEGFIDDVAFEGGKGEDHKLKLGSKSFIEGFEEGLIGHSAGEQVDLDLTFPDDYQNDELRGKATRFEVTINSVNQTVLPEVNQDFVKLFGIEDGSQESLNDEIKRNMQREVDLTLHNRLKEKVFEALSQNNEIELPQSLIANEQDRLKIEFKERMAQQGVNNNEANDIDSALFAEEAEKRITLQLILTEIIKKNELKAKPEKVRSKVEQAASNYKDPSELINACYSDKKQLAGFESLVLEEEAVDWILAQASVSDKVYTFDEVMNQAQTPA